MRTVTLGRSKSVLANAKPRRPEEQPEYNILCRCRETERDRRPKLRTSEAQPERGDWVQKSKEAVRRQELVDRKVAFFGNTG